MDHSQNQKGATDMGMILGITVALRPNNVINGSRRWAVVVATAAS
jgi:hypothetical protein